MHTSTLGRDWVTEDGNSEAKEKPSSASMITLAVDEIAPLGEVGKYKVEGLRVQASSAWRLVSCDRIKRTG